MEGGHGNAAAFGRNIECMGVDDAVTIDLAAATLCIILGDVLDARISRYLIEKYKLKPNYICSNNTTNFKSNLINKNYLTRNFKSNRFNTTIFLNKF